MKISIDNPLRPFSHNPGVTTVIPNTGLLIQVFPCKLIIPRILELIFLLEGPLKEFTVLNDLDKGEIRVSGRSPQGFIRYRIYTNPQGAVRLELIKTPLEGILVNQRIFKQGDELDLYTFSATPLPRFLERLSFGNHKAQDIDLIRRRLDLSEIWPLIFQLGQSIPKGIQENYPSIPLLDNCRQVQKSEYLNEAWLNFYQSHFYSLLAPRLFDDDFQGFPNPTSAPNQTPIFLLVEAANLIRKSLIDQREKDLYILPFLPPQLHCGRFVQAAVTFGSIDLEWTKKTIRRFVLNTTKNQEVTFHFKNCKSFRVRRKHTDKGEVINNEQSLFLEKNCRYFFDNFA